MEDTVTRGQNVAILGAGFTGLSAAYSLLKKGYRVTIFEKESDLGGLAVGFSNPKWRWTLERAYHHWFTNDQTVLNLARELGHKVIIKRSSTDVWVNGKHLPFDSVQSLLLFTPLPIIDRLRVGICLLYLKLTNRYDKFENVPALSWIRRFTGEKATKMIWKPLFFGKFGSYKDDIALSWFWARIKKRTSRLAYPEGGFKKFADTLGSEIKKMGGQVLTDTSVILISSEGKNVQIKTEAKTLNFDKAIITLPSPIFAKITTGLPKTYVKKICSIPHLHAMILHGLRYASPVVSSSSTISDRPLSCFS